jgi:quinone-modifying oxidoreductase subunit QmoC
MSEAQLIKPDLGYVKEVMNAGGESLKKCYQCATCSVVCEIAPDGKPFPRKEMVWAQWGQKEKLVNNPDVWLCHQCSDCTAKCPRDAKPGEVLGAIRRTAYTHFAWPGFMGNLFADTKFLPILFAIPALLIFLVMKLNGTSLIPDGPIIFSKMMPITTGVDALFLPFAALALFSAFVSLNEFWKGMEAQVDASVPRKGFGAAAKEFLGDIVSHATFKKCISSAGRSTAHMLVFYGFIGLFITTNIVLVYEWGHKLFGLHLPQTPLFWHGLGLPPKIIGNVSAVALIAGGVMMIQNRMANNEDNPASAYDWTFLAVILLVGLTGFLAQITRIADMAGVAYPMYFLHLVFVFYVIAYLPFSKLAHLLYRSLAVIHAKNVGRGALLLLKNLPKRRKKSLRLRPRHRTLHAKENENDQTSRFRRTEPPLRIRRRQAQ